MRSITADNLKRNELSYITEITCSEISNKLMEMNCMPGESITLKYIAPLGDPMVFEIGGVLIGMRRQEAFNIITTNKA
jgi:ferrous iron transport protein A